MDAPKIIWLQRPNRDPENEWCGEVTWCEDKQTYLTVVFHSLVATRYRHRDEQGVTTYGFTEPHMLDFTRALLQRLEQEGWQLVPKEPTEEMCMSAMITMVEENKGIEYGPYVGYKAMLAAAPKVIE